jgi:hypothetical protein
VTDLDECWCCDGLHDSPHFRCPDCREAGCDHFGGGCQVDHERGRPDGGQPSGVMYRATCEDCSWSYEKGRRQWVESAADNHEALYRTVDGHETQVHSLNPATEQEEQR